MVKIREKELKNISGGGIKGTLVGGVLAPVAVNAIACGFVDPPSEVCLFLQTTCGMLIGHGIEEVFWPIIGDIVVKKYILRIMC